MDAFAKIAEERIIRAMEAGEFDNLPGAGKPLVIEDETFIPEELRLMYRVLKRNGFIPQELELRKEIVSLRELIDTLDDDKERLKKIRELDFKLLKFNMTRKRPFTLEDIPRYTEKLSERLLFSDPGA